MSAFSLDMTISAQAYYFTEIVTRIEDTIPLDMVYVKGGRFVMGSSPDEPERLDSEEPQREVSISDFFIGRYPVTQAQWRAVAQLNQQKISLDPDPSKFKGENHPVEQVSWYEAVEFCERLQAYTKRPYRLPSEAEWEYACRAGTKTPFAFGQTITTKIANYDGSHIYNNGPKGECRGKTTPVNYFSIANGFGLCDMHGNVWEWCVDRWHESYEDAPIDDSSRIDNNKDRARVVRGGSWDYDPRFCRSAARLYYTPENRNFSTGFRVICRAPRTLRFPTD